MARDEQRVEVKSVIDLVLVKKGRLRYVQDVRAVRLVSRINTYYGKN